MVDLWSFEKKEAPITCESREKGRKQATLADIRKEINN